MPNSPASLAMETFTLALTRSLCVGALLLGAATHSVRAATSTNVTEVIEIARSAYGAERKVLVTETLQLTENENREFWPIYEKYRKEMEGLGDSLVKLVLEYADLYPEVPEQNARSMVRDFLQLESRILKVRRSYARKFQRVLPATKVARLLQLENRMDLGLRLQLAGAVPLMPGDK
jgi:hypothetical protein